MNHDQDLIALTWYMGRRPSIGYADVKSDRLVASDLRLSAIFSPHEKSRFTKAQVRNLLSRSNIIFYPLKLQTTVIQEHLAFRNIL